MQNTEILELDFRTRWSAANPLDLAFPFLTILAFFMSPFLFKINSSVLALCPLAGWSGNYPKFWRFADILLTPRGG